MKIKEFKTVNGNIYGKDALCEVREIESIRDMLLSSFELYKDNVAYLVKDSLKAPYREIKYSEVQEDVFSLATALFNEGLNDKRIAVIGENSYEWEITYLSVVCGTGTIVPIDKELPQEEINNLLQRANASAIVFSEKIYAKHTEFIDGLEGIKTFCMAENEKHKSLKTLIKEGKALREEGHKEFDEAEVLPDDVDILLFTSGTTGNAKAVMLSHKNIASNLMNMCAMINIPPEYRFFSLLPLHHTYECTCGFLCPLYRGSSIAFCQGLKYLQKNMQEAKPTICLAVPMIVEAMYDKIMKEIKKKGKEKVVKIAMKASNGLLKLGVDMRAKLFAEVREALGGKLEIFVSGAAPGNPEALKFFRGVGIYAIQGYGLTETSPIVGVNRLGKFDDMAAGIPVPEVEVKISEPDADGVGEIIARGDNIMKGYYENEEATNEAIKDGWFYTGDLGYLKDGFIYITGRKKDVIITANGKNVYPENVEKYLNGIEYVKESMVYATKDEKGNDTVVSALIVPDYDVISEKFGEGVSDTAINDLFDKEIKTVNTLMPSYQAIKEFTVRKEPLIRTTTQKIKRFANLPE